MSMKRLTIAAIAALGLSLSGYVAWAGPATQTGFASMNQTLLAGSEGTITLIGGGYGGMGGHSGFAGRGFSGHGFSGHGFARHAFRGEHEFRHHGFRHRRFFRGGVWVYDWDYCDWPYQYPYCYY